MDLIKIRLVSFGYGLASLVGTAFIAVLISPQFAMLIKANFGEGAVTMIVLLLIPELAKHLRNLLVAKKVGTAEDTRNSFYI